MFFTCTSRYGFMEYQKATCEAVVCMIYMLCATWAYVLLHREPFSRAMAITWYFFCRLYRLFVYFDKKSTSEVGVKVNNISCKLLQWQYCSSVDPSIRSWITFCCMLSHGGRRRLTFKLRQVTTVRSCEERKSGLNWYSNYNSSAKIFLWAKSCYRKVKKYDYTMRKQRLCRAEI